nr:galactose oxidase [Streptomyces sp. DSM 41633]
MKYRPSRRTRRLAISTAVVLALAGANGPWLYRFSTERYHEYKINQPDYKAANGHWSFLDIPSEFRINTIHAALLHTGKVLIVAGSGNDQKNFDAGTFDTELWDPAENTFQKIPTPEDFFCGGHAQRPDGRLLIAGGTARYEVLDDKVQRAGGGMRVKNE